MKSKRKVSKKIVVLCQRGEGGRYVLQDNLVSKADLSCNSSFALISDEVLGNVEMSALENPLTVANLHYQLSA